jgi:FlaG/FlaF family flagellin (archaellin)
VKVSAKNFGVFLIAAIAILAGLLLLILKSSQQKPIDTSDWGVKLTQTATTQPLFLEITSPEDGATVSETKILLKGKTAAGVEVFINELEIKSNTNGDFSANLNLEEGENIIDVVVNDSLGNYLEKEITVSCETF